MRWAEIALFAAPFLLYAAWRIAAAWAHPAAVWSIVTLLAALLVGTIWLGLTRRLDREAIYVPAHIEDGHIVPGHGVPMSTR